LRNIFDFLIYFDDLTVHSPGTRSCMRTGQPRQKTQTIGQYQNSSVITLPFGAKPQTLAHIPSLSFALKEGAIPSPTRRAVASERRRYHWWPRCKPVGGERVRVRCGFWYSLMNNRCNRRPYSNYIGRQPLDWKRSLTYAGCSLSAPNGRGEGQGEVRVLARTTTNALTCSKIPGKLKSATALWAWAKSPFIGCSTATAIPRPATWARLCGALPRTWTSSGEWKWPRTIDGSTSCRRTQQRT
jgi:hypothetical protein